MLLCPRFVELLRSFFECLESMNAIAVEARTCSGKLQGARRACKQQTAQFCADNVVDMRPFNPLPSKLAVEQIIYLCGRGVRQ